MNEYNPQEVSLHKKNTVKKKEPLTLHQSQVFVGNAGKTFIHRLNRPVFYFGNLENQKKSTIQVSQLRRLQLS
jgi:hypothetical protein